VVLERTFDHDGDSQEWMRYNEKQKEEEEDSRLIHTSVGEGRAVVVGTASRGMTQSELDVSMGRKVNRAKRLDCGSFARRGIDAAAA
jgi:hypothetical protein